MLQDKVTVLFLTKQRLMNRSAIVHNFLFILAGEPIKLNTRCVVSAVLINLEISNSPIIVELLSRLHVSFWFETNVSCRYKGRGLVGYFPSLIQVAEWTGLNTYCEIINLAKNDIEIIMLLVYNLYEEMFHNQKKSLKNLRMPCPHGTRWEIPPLPSKVCRLSRYHS